MSQPFFCLFDGRVFFNVVVCVAFCALRVRFVAWRLGISSLSVGLSADLAKEDLRELGAGVGGGGGGGNTYGLVCRCLEKKKTEMDGVSDVCVA